MMDPAEMGSDHRWLPAPLSARLPPGARVLVTVGSEAQEDADYRCKLEQKIARYKEAGFPIPPQWSRTLHKLSSPPPDMEDPQ